MTDIISGEKRASLLRGETESQGLLFVSSIYIDAYVSVTSQNVGQLQGRLEGILCIAFEITGFF
jgi:hypothetical protein